MPNFGWLHLGQVFELVPLLSLELNLDWPGQLTGRVARLCLISKGESFPHLEAEWLVFLCFLCGVAGERSSSGSLKVEWLRFS